MQVGPHERVSFSITIRQYKFNLVMRLTLAYPVTDRASFALHIRNDIKISLPFAVRIKLIDIKISVKITLYCFLC